MPNWVRVKDPKTGHEYTTATPAEGEQILKDKDATDRHGRPLPAKHHVTKAATKKAATKKAAPSAATQKENTP